VSYGPLLFALPIADTKDANTPDPAAKWNYALDAEGKTLGADITVERGPMPTKWDWPLESPLKLKANAVSFDWKPEPAKALPSRPVVSDELPDKVTLIPCGCTKFRVSMFPVTERVFKHFEPASAGKVNAAGTTGTAGASGQPAQAPKASPILLPQDLLKDKFIAPAKECKGWGKWETPFVIANSDDEAGLRFCLYWNKGENMASPDGRNRRIAHIKRLYSEYNADMWRSDCTAGEVVGANHSAVRGFYAMLDQLYREIANFQWEDCSGGGRIKDFGAMKRCAKVFMSDGNQETMVRQEFHDGSYAYPPAQLMGCVGYVNPKGPTALKLAFRSCSMGAPEWFLDAPNGGNGGPKWSDEDKVAGAEDAEQVLGERHEAIMWAVLERADGGGVTWPRLLSLPEDARPRSGSPTTSKVVLRRTAGDCSCRLSTVPARGWMRSSTSSAAKRRDSVVVSPVRPRECGGCEGSEVVSSIARQGTHGGTSRVG
jgi:hypothetical protein